MGILMHGSSNGLGSVNGVRRQLNPQLPTDEKADEQIKIESQFAKKLLPELATLESRLEAWSDATERSDRLQQGDVVLGELAAAAHAYLALLTTWTEKIDVGAAAEVNHLLERVLPPRCGLDDLRKTSDFERMLTGATALWVQHRLPHRHQDYYVAWNQEVSGAWRATLFDGCESLVGPRSPWRDYQTLVRPFLVLAFDFLARRARENGLRPEDELRQVDPYVPLTPQGHLILAALHTKLGASAALTTLEQRLDWGGEGHALPLLGAIAIWSAQSPIFAAMADEWGWDYRVDLASPLNANERAALCGSAVRAATSGHVAFNTQVGKRVPSAYPASAPLQRCPATLWREFAPFKALMVGPAEVGKTMALTAAVETDEATPASGPRLIAEERFQEFRARTRRQREQLLPSQTAGASTYQGLVEFERCGQRMPFEVLDFRGEDVQAGRSRPEFDAWLVQADALIIFLDDEVLAAGAGAERKAADRAAWYTTLLRERQRLRPDAVNTPIAFVLSKADKTLGADIRLLQRSSLLGPALQRELLYLPIGTARRPSRAPAGDSPFERLCIALLHDPANNLSVNVRRAVQRALERFESVFTCALAQSRFIEVFHMVSVRTPEFPDLPATGLREALLWSASMLHGDFLKRGRDQLALELLAQNDRARLMGGKLQDYDRAIGRRDQLLRRVQRAALRSGGVLSWLVSKPSNAIAKYRQAQAEKLDAAAAKSIAQCLELAETPTETSAELTPPRARAWAGEALHQLNQRIDEVSAVLDDVQRDAARLAASSTR